MKKILFIFFIVSCFCFSYIKVNDAQPMYTNKTDTLNVVLMCGQSNMEGGTNLVYSSTYSGYQKAFIWYKLDSTVLGVPTTYNKSVNSSYRGINSYVGPDVSFGYVYNQLTNKKILMIKYALGGSAMVDDGTTTTAGIWQVDADYTRSNGLAHWRKLKYEWMLPIISYFKSKGIVLQFVSFLWCQGEADAASSYRAANYQTKLIQLIDSVQWNLNYRNVLSPKFKPIITRIHNRFYPARTYDDDIRTSQVNVANYFNGYWINSDTFSLYSDSTHWTPVGQISQGYLQAHYLVDSILNN